MNRSKDKVLFLILGKARRSEKLWQFLINLLTDKRFCPHLIRWENFQEGTFKFIKTDQVAQLWGNRKKNTKMNYEKFSRAMRFIVINIMINIM